MRPRASPVPTATCWPRFEPPCSTCTANTRERDTRVERSYEKKRCGMPTYQKPVRSDRSLSQLVAMENAALNAKVAATPTTSESKIDAAEAA